MSATPAALHAAQDGHAQLHSQLHHGLPAARDENWKYANLRALERLSLVPTPLPGSQLRARALAELPPRIEDARRIVVLDGVLLEDPDASTSSKLPRGAISVVAHDSDAPQPAADTPADLRFARINRLLARECIEIEVSGDEPAHLELVVIGAAAGREALSHPQLRLHLHAGARLTLVQRLVSLSKSMPWSNLLLEARLEPGAVLTHLRLQQAEDGAYLHESLLVDVARDARYEFRGIDSGARWSRLTARVDLAGAGSTLVWHAVDAASGTQHHDTAVRVVHAGERSRTEQIVRAVASGRAHIGCNGHLVVVRDARGAATSQSLRGLLAGERCEINLRPQLEINTDEVRATHGATTGALDEAMRFYLRSRGIEAESAEALLKWAFVGDVLARIEHRQLRHLAAELVAKRIGMPQMLEVLR